jgi:hypothetical protein
MSTTSAPSRPIRALWRAWSDARPQPPSPRAHWPLGLRRARRAGIALLLTQFGALCVWSGIQASRGGLTSDFALFQQAITLITRGELNPWSTVAGYHFFQDHGFALLWLLAPLEALWPHPVTLLWIQNAALLAGELVAFGWICDIAAGSTGAQRAEARWPVALVLLGALLLAANPWLVWAESFDFHVEVFAAAAALATARNLLGGRRRAYAYLVVCLLCGDVGATYALAVGLGAALVGRRFLKGGLIVAVCGFAWVMLLHAAGATLGTDIGGLYPGLTTGLGNPREASILTVAEGLLRRPGNALGVLWLNRLAAWSNLSASGLIGLAWLPVSVPALMVLAEGQLAPSPDFSLPGFQQVALYLFVAVGTIGLLAWLRRSVAARHPRLLMGLLAVLAVNAIAWSAVWLWAVPVRWLRVSPATATTLRRLAARIPASDEVVAQDGILEDFASRRYVYLVSGGRSTVPVRTRQVWFVLAPYEGIQPQSVADANQDIRRISALAGVRLVTHRDGVWAFRLTAARGNARRLTVGSAAGGRMPAWAITGAAGKALLGGGADRWSAAGNGHAGYVVDEAYWRFGPGRYRARVWMQSAGPVHVELWDATTGRLLARVSPQAVRGPAPVTLSARLKRTGTQQLFSGWGPWVTRPDPPPGNELEVRVWSPGGPGRVRVYSVALSPISAGSS